MAPLNGTIKLPVWHRKMAPFFTGAILLLDIEHVLFPSNKLLSRDQYQALWLATFVHVILQPYVYRFPPLLTK